jgi:hypothetical protein
MSPCPRRAGPTFTRLYRFDNSVRGRRIELEEFLLLADLRDGDSIATGIPAWQLESTARRKD